MSLCVPGRSQNVVFGGLLSVFASRSPTTAGSTVTAPAGAFSGPAAGLAHTRATDAEGAPDADGVPADFAGASGLLVQPVATGRVSASAATGNAQRRLLNTTPPPSR
ncbi:hypothetical protein [Streptomyces sp.]|uniref:hypothetical protein n=1 Tax=Streptomyces sp. TaxID=1931 RepID=UPI002F94A1DE